MLQTLSMPTKAVAPIEKPSGGLLKGSRKPFPIPKDISDDEASIDLIANDEIPIDDELSNLRQAQVKPKRAAKPQPMPLLPAILLGALSVTAVGGLLLWMLVALLT